MIELPLDYLNNLANQSVFICALLCGFSLTVLVLLMENESNNRLKSNMFKSAIIATGAFLVSIFAMTSIIMKTTPGYPLEVISSDLTFTRLLGGITFYVGMTAVIVIVSLSGWTKSKTMGWFSTIVGVITFVMTILLTS